ncbi:MAG: tRNA pseudouridine(55) synthase TruB, partial [Helicobacter sp.]|nr:tRNA pseudouridine(55) synthase TruB [Helicobacter sp.]
KIHDVQKFQKDNLESLLQSFCGKIPYTPPKYSAKKINGNPAYKLAREGVDVVLKEQIMEVFKIQLCAYRHPFLSFKVAVSEGSYIRSLGQLIANRLGCVGSLSYLERLSEGGLIYEREKNLNPLEILNLPILEIKPQMQGIREKIQNGKKVTEEELGIYKKGEYIVKFDDFFSIISNQEKNIEYLVNRIPLC